MKYNKTMKKTYIIPSVHRNALMKQLLIEYPSQTELEIMSLPQYLSRFHEAVSSSQAFIRSFQTIQNHASRLRTLAGVFQYPENVQELYDFRQEMAAFSISYDQLPSQNSRERELIDLLSSLDNLEAENKAIQAGLAELTDASDLVIYDFQCDLFVADCIRQLVAKGAQLIEPPSLTPAHTGLYHALNPRQEAESLAQYIITHNVLEGTIILCDTNDYANLKAVFDRYQIGVSTPLALYKNRVVQAFLKVMDFLIHPSLDTLSSLLINNSLHLEDAAALLSCIRQFKLDFKANTLHLPDVNRIDANPWINSSQQQRLRKDLNAGQSALDYLKTQLFSLLQRPLREQIVGAYDLMVNERSEKYALKVYLEENLDTLLLQPETAYALMVYQLNRLTTQHHEATNFTVLDQHHLPVISPAALFVLGANQNKFPATQAKKGIIDEDYCAQIPQYPSLQSRLRHQLHFYTSLYTCADTVIFSFADGDYQGKVSEVAFEVESHFSSLSRWPYQFNESFHKKEHRISPATAQRLFFHEGRLHGSVSRFESYIRCPYQYFLRYGLHLDVREDFSLEARVLGSIQHQLLELMIKYPYTKDTLPDLVHQQFLSLYRLYPNQETYYTFLEEIITKSLAIHLEIITGFAKTTSLKPIEAEYTFSTPIADIDLQGQIDRIDQDQHGLRIIDYKTSSHAMREADFVSGLQLQLMTYALSAQRQFNQPISGIYYYTLTHPIITSDYGKVAESSGNLTIKTSQDSQAEFRKAHQYNGWTFRDPNLSYDAVDAIHGFRAKGDTITVFGGLKNYETCIDILSDVYTSIRNSIADGVIDAEPTAQQCHYCPFVSLCQYKGDTNLEKPKLTARTLKEKDDAVE